MERFLTVISCALAISSFVFSYTSNLYISLILFLIISVLLYFSFYLERKIKSHGNEFMSKLMYYLSRNDSRYNIENAKCTYSYLGNGKYECEKRITITPIANDVDCIEDKYAWTADSKTATLQPVNQENYIAHIHKDGLWTCYTVDFGKICKRKVHYETGSKIINLLDPNGEALPFYSTQVTKKTKVLVVTVKFPEDQLPKDNVYFIEKPADNNKDAVTKPEILKYDKNRGGFSKTVHFPRKGWQYVISWGEK